MAIQPTDSALFRIGDHIINKYEVRRVQLGRESRNGRVTKVLLYFKSGDMIQITSEESMRVFWNAFVKLSTPLRAADRDNWNGDDFE